MQTPAPHRARFGAFELDLKTGELHEGGRRIMLQEQPFQVLRILVERRGELATRDEIRNKLWPNDTVVEFDHAINTAIKKLREALGDPAAKPKYIETVARRGYRLIAPVEWVTPVSDPESSQQTAALPTDMPPSGDTPRFVETLPRRGYRFIYLTQGVFELPDQKDELLVATNEVSTSGCASSATTPSPLAGRSSVEATPSIAVLPFANLSPDKENEYFSDGLAEDILNVLAHIPGLKVIARTSSFVFRGKRLDIRKIGETLGVRAILEGSVRRVVNRIRVTAQLINAADGCHLWSERYDRELTDVFAMQDEIATAIVAALQWKLVDQPSFARRHQPALPAYESFLKGRHQYFKNTPVALTRAKGYFEHAIALDSKYAEPHAGLGLHYFFLGVYGVQPASEMLPLVRVEAKKALACLGSEPGAHALLGAVAATYEYDWKAAADHFRRAMSANPIPPEVRVREALYNLAPRGRFQEAIATIEKGLEQDPLSVLFRSYLSFILSAAGMYERSLAEAQKALEIDEGFWATYSMIANAYAFRGMFAEAAESAERAFQLAPWDSAAAGLLAALYSRIGNEKRAREILANPILSRIGMVLYHLLRSELDFAADWYERAIEEHEPFAVVWAVHDFTKPLRASGRWPALAKLMNLPEVA
jgi:TolB-like protein/DNA-binding winged helix-turn-helix (wHTH) protein